MEYVKEYFGLILCKHEARREEILKGYFERDQSHKILRALMKGRTVSNEIRKWLSVITY